MSGLPTIETVAAELWTPELSDDRLISQITNIKGHYDEPQRLHHNFDHPLEMFKDLIRYRELLKDPRVVGWTILYHDIVYDPEAKPGINEELSAQLAEAETPAFLPVRGVRKVAAYTRATAAHLAEGDDTDLELFLDIDLAVLGATPERYDRYAAGIREEYAHVPPEIYVPARIGILRDLLKRFEGKGVFRTEVFRERSEEAAKANIAREIEQLEASL